LAFLSLTEAKLKVWNTKLGPEEEIKKVVQMHSFSKLNLNEGNGHFFVRGKMPNPPKLAKFHNTQEQNYKLKVNIYLILLIVVNQT